MSASQNLRDLVSHRVTFDYENGCHVSGYVSTVRPAAGEPVIMALTRVEITNDAGEVLERHRELLLVPSVMVSYRTTEGPSAASRTDRGPNQKK